jgi:molecular chaperone DnaJ
MVVVEELEHELFERQDDDVYTDVVVDFPTAALGGDIEVPTLEGTSVLTIEPGTQPGSLLRMKGKGIPHLNARGKGDQIVRFNVYVPTSLNSQEKKALKELSDSKHFTPPDKRERRPFFERVKEAFS